MKTARLVSIILVLVIAFSVFTPAPAYAKSAEAAATFSMVEKAKSTVARLTITNKTGGTMYISVSGAGRSYYFAASNAGKNTFELLPGKYTYTITTSACRGQVTKTKNFKAGSATSVGSYVCRK
jgi:YHS domain-containing protein